MDRDSLRVQLMLGSTLVNAAPRAVLDALVALRITSSVGSRSGFQLSLSMPASSPLRALLAGGSFAPKRRLVAAVLWRNAVTVLMDGVITRHDLAPASATGAYVLTLTGEDLSVLMDLTTRVVSHAGLGPEDQVSAICARYAEYGISPDVQQAPEQDVENPQRHSDVQRDTDLGYLGQLAGEVGYVSYLAPGPAPGSSSLYWGPGLRSGIPQPPLTTNFGPLNTVESLSFDFNGLAPTNYVRNGQVISPDDLRKLRPPLARAPAEALLSRQLPPTAMLDPAQRNLLAGSLTASSIDSVGAEGELDVRRYGTILTARRLVSVRGAGNSHDGRYFVTSVTHQLTPGHFRQSFRLSREGLGATSDRVPG